MRVKIGSTGVRFVTIWDNPDERFSSEYGVVTYRKWCEHELLRFNKAGDKVAIKEEAGAICLYRPDVPEVPEQEEIAVAKSITLA